MSDRTWIVPANPRGRQFLVPKIQFPSTNGFPRSRQVNIDRLLQQIRICEYLKIRCCHQLSFLDLPTQIRYQIYELVCVPNHCEIYHSITQSTGYESQAYSYDYLYRREEDRAPEVDYRVTRSLFLTSRFIYIDVATFVYSRNKICFRRRSHNDIMGFGHLSYVSLASLRHVATFLHVIFGCKKIEEYGCCREDAHHLNLQQEIVGEPISTQSAGFQDALLQWYEVSEYFAAYVQTSKLQLEFTYDTTSYQAATRALKTFHKIGKLKHCAIRLSTYPNTQLQQLAKAFVRRATERDDSNHVQPFRLMDLPEEIRRCILGFTDLVTPYAEVYWRLRRGYHIIRPMPGTVSRLLTPRQYAHYKALHSEMCSHMTYFGCFCPCCHGAFASTHRCWAPPTSLFLVCRQLLREARAIFFSRNRFIVMPWTRLHEPVIKGPTRLDPSIFLTEIIPATCLRYLRFLEIIFPQFGQEYFQSSPSPLIDWGNTLELTKDQFNLSHFTLRIYINDCYQSYTARPQLFDEFDETIETYAALLRPLAQLNAMRRFFADISWPFRKPYPETDFEHLQRKAAMDFVAEKEWVMQSDNYDPFVHRKLNEAYAPGSGPDIRAYIWNDEELLESGWWNLLFEIGTCSWC